MSDLFDDMPAYDPHRSISRGDAPVLPKRFYKAADFVAEGGGFALRVDGRTVRTPAKQLVKVADEAIAAALAAEWNAQKDVIDPATMPLTRLVNAAIDGVAKNPGPVREEILRYAGTDLLCYRAADPERLVATQEALWSPVLQWMHDVHGTRFVLAQGILHVPQYPETLEAFDRALGDPDPLTLAALNTATTLTGSAVLAIALRDGHLSPDVAWQAAHVDEDFEISVWGEDAEASARREARKREFLAAAMVIVGK